jgi:hypothetical protein
MHDVDKYVDLNCLDVIDAKAICKQKIYDVALLARGQRPSSQHVGPFDKNKVQRLSDKIYVLIL